MCVFPTNCLLHPDFLLRRVSMHVPPPPHPIILPAYQPSTDWHPDWRTWGASWNLYSRVRSSPGSTSSKYTCVCVCSPHHSSSNRDARQTQQAVRGLRHDPEAQSVIGACVVVPPASSLSAHTLVCTQLVCAVQLLRCGQSSSSHPPSSPLSEPAAALSLLCPSTCLPGV